MAKDEDTMFGPFTVDLNVYLSNGEQVAVAKCNMPVGVPLSAESVQAMLAEAEKSAQTQAASFKLMDRNEFENTILAERTGGMTAGQHFATKADWDESPPLDDVEKLKDALRWCSASTDFHTGGQAREGWLGVVAPLLYTAAEVEMLRRMSAGRGPDEEDAPGNDEGA